MVALGAGNLAIGGTMLPAERRMRRAAGRGIIALEFAGSEPARAGVDASVGTRRSRGGAAAAVAGLRLFGHICAVSSPGGAGRGRTARSPRPHRLAAVAPALGQAQLAAGAFDADRERRVAGRTGRCAR